MNKSHNTAAGLSQTVNRQAIDSLVDENRRLREELEKMYKKRCSDFERIERLNRQVEELHQHLCSMPGI